MMDRRAFITGMAGGLLAAPLPSWAERKVYRLGYLSTDDRPTSTTEHLLRALHDLGYNEGQNLAVEFRWAAGKPERLPVLAEDLVRARVDLIVALSNQGVRAATAATETIPIVFVSGNPVGHGVASSLARPSGNATGVALQVITPDKAAQLLKDAVPKLARAVYLYDPRSTTADRLKVFEEQDRVALARLGLTIRLTPFPDPQETDRVLAKVDQATDGLILENSPSVQIAAERLCALARDRRLPTLGTGRFFAERGCLVGYGEDSREWTRQMAVFVDRILKGARPADLPIEQPTKIELVINLKTAKALGLTIPPALLQRADQVIE